MKLNSIFIALALMLSIISTSAKEPEEYAGLTELLDNMLSIEYEHKKLEIDTGFHVGEESKFLTANASKKNRNIDLLIADSLDENDTPLPLGWEDVGKLLNEPILSSHNAHTALPVYQLWLGCLVAFLGLSFIATGCGMFCRKGREEMEQVSCLPSFERR
jgi:hypothetical protein